MLRRVSLGIKKNGAFLTAIIFSLSFILFEEFLFELPQIRFFLFVFSLEYDPNYFPLEMLSLGYAFCMCCLFVWASFVSDVKYKWIFFVLFSIATVVQYSYWQTFGRFATATDFRSAINSPLHLWLDAAFLFFNWVSLIPAIVYGLLLLVVRTRASFTRHLYAVLTMMIIVVGIDTVDYFVKFDHARNHGNSVFLFFRTLHNASFSNLEVAERQRIAFESDTLPTNNLVLIIDESIRSDHLSINGYARPTTPYLHTISDKGYLYNWGTAVAGGSCSMISNPLLITGIPVTENARLFADEYSVLSIKLRRLKQQSESAPPLVDLTPTLFDYAKAMGYRTHYLDTQTRYLWNGLGLRDLDFIDHWLTIDDFGDDVDSDFRAADYIYQTVKSSNGNFILLNKRGVHFRYDESFPADQMIWSPPPPKWDYREYPEFGINVYDSGIRYNVNTFFQRMLPDFETLENTIFIYTSDHGQTLFEDGLQWPHCGATNKEAMVPLLLIGDVEQTLDTQFPASHSNIFSSFLDLMAVPEAVRAYPYAPSLLTARADSRADRLFLTGVFSIINFDDTVSPQN